MASPLTTGKNWSTGDQPTAANLNLQFTGAVFASAAVDDSTIELNGGAMRLKDGGISPSKLATNSVETAKILDANITTAKILDANVTTAKILDANITTAKILDANVTFAKLATAAVATAAEVKAETTAKLVAANLLTNHPGVVKAYGVVVGTGSGSNTLRTGSYNVGSIAQSSSDSDYTRVTLTNAMASSTNYIVQVTQEIRATSDANATVLIVDASNFDIGTNYDNKTLHFVVWGELA